MRKKIILAIAILLTTLDGISQKQSPQTSDVKHHLLQTDGSGRITGNLPELIFDGEKINFKINQPSESFDLYEKMLADKARRAKTQLNKLLSEAEKLKVLADVYGITAGDINLVITDLNAVIANQSASAQTYIPVYTVAKKKYYSVVTGNDNDAFEPNTKSKDFTIASNGDKVNFTISKTNPFKKITYDWLQHTKANYSGSFNPEVYRILLEQAAALIKQTEKFVKGTESILKGLGNNERQRNTAKRSVNNAADLLTYSIDSFLRVNANKINQGNYKTWILKWLWYQSNTMPALNPFTFRAGDDIGIEPDTSLLEVLRLKIQAREEFYKAIDMKKATLEQLDTIINQVISLRREKAALEKQAKNFVAIKAGNDKAIADFGNTSSQLNEGLLVAGKKGEAKKLDSYYWLRHHDASNNYQLLNENIKDEYLEDDRVVILSHNLKPGESAKLNISFKDITNDVSYFTEMALPVVNALSSVVSNPLFANFAFDGSLTPLQKLDLKVSELRSFMKALEYLLQQSNPELDIKETVDKSSSYHSELSNPPKKITGPKKATYYMNTSTAASEVGKDKPVADTFTYRINKLYRLFPMAGAFYTVNRFAEVKDGKVNEVNHTRFVVGVKVYLKKTDIRNRKFFTGKDEHGDRLWKSRTNLQVAFDVEKPLNNLYLGAGLDLWPGFCISVGGVANKYSYTQYQNTDAVRTRNTYRGGFYCGISTDISLFTDVAKLLNLSK